MRRTRRVGRCRDRKPMERRATARGANNEIQGKERQRELHPKPVVDPLLQRLMNGDWAAVEEMSKEIAQDGETIQEVGLMIQDLKWETRSVLTRDDIQQDAEVIQEAKATVEGLKEHAQNRDAIREAGIAREAERMENEHAQNGRTCLQSGGNSDS